MTDQTPEPFTLYVYLNTQTKERFVVNRKIPLSTIHEYLGEVLIDPDDIVPEPAIPTEPGLYLDARGESGPVWRVNVDGTAGQVGGYGRIDSAPAPFRRLVVQRPTPTRDQIEAALDPHVDQYRERRAVDAVMAVLANGYSND